MADDDETGPLSESEEWRTAFVGMHLHFYRSLLRLLVQKKIIENMEGRNLMYSIAESMRAGGDRAGAAEITYHFASLLERIGNDVMDDPENDQTH